MADTEPQDPSPKPCPFCGSTMVFERIAWAKCLSCEACGPIRTPEGSVIQLWNKRQETRWQPMDTAPKDGADILLCVMGPDAGQYAEVGYWGMPVALFDDGTGREQWVDHSRHPIEDIECMLTVVAWKPIELYLDGPPME